MAVEAPATRGRRTDDSRRRAGAGRPSGRRRGVVPGRLVAWRATARMARRDAWRHKGRSGLLAVMVALPVLLGCAVSVINRSADLDPQDVVAVELGRSAQASVGWSEPGTPQRQAVDGRESSYASGVESAATPAPAERARILARGAALLPPRDRIVATSTWVPEGLAVRSGDRALNPVLRELDGLDGLAGRFDVTAGRWATTAGEVVITGNLARSAGLAPGAVLDIRLARDEQPRRATVTGVVDGMALARSQEVIAPTGTLFPPQARTEGETAWFVVGPDPVSWDTVLDLNALGGIVLSRAVAADPPQPSRVPYLADQPGGPGVSGETLTVGAVAVGLVLLQIALLAGPAIAVGARRNQRTLALLAASGAERRHLRAVVLATSGVVGIAGGLVAAVLGVGAGRLGMWALERWGDEVFPRTDIQVLDLLVLVSVGALTAIAAAVLPARQAARLDVVAALTGRRAAAAPRLGLPVLGLVVTAAGAALGIWGAQKHAAVPVVLGIALGEIGLVMAAGGIVALVARTAGRLPLAPRLALRDAVRHRGRTAPAVAAVMAALAGGVAATLYIAAQDVADRTHYRSSGALGTVRVDLQNGGQGDERTADQVRAAADRSQAALARHMALGTVAPLLGFADGGYLSVQRPPGQACPLDAAVPVEGVVVAGPVADVPPTAAAALRDDPRCRPVAWGPDSVSLPSSVLLDDGSALAVLLGRRVPAAQEALAAGRVILSDPRDLWPDGTVRMQLITDVTQPDGEDGQSVRTMRLPAVVLAPTVALDGPVVPPSAARSAGVDLEQQGFLASTTAMPSTEQQQKAAADLEDLGAYLQVERGYTSEYGPGLIALVVAALLVTLVGTFTAVGLAATEGRADVATLAAVGASPGLRRRLAAGQAGVIAGLGSALGLASGALTGWALVRLQQPSTVATADGGTTVQGDPAWAFTVPWAQLGLIGLGIPLLTVAVAFTLTRSKLPITRRLTG